MLAALGGEDGCRRLAAEFYGRVAGDALLRSLFPGKSLRCATEEFGAFLIQFLGGDEEQTQYRWWLSLRESHARFQVSAVRRAAWLKHMRAALQAADWPEDARRALRQFFEVGAVYVTGGEAGEPSHAELAARWTAQKKLDAAIAALAAGRDSEALVLAPQFADRPAVFVGLLARMLKAGRGPLINFAAGAIDRASALGSQRFAGRPLLHWACAAGALAVVEQLLRVGTPPDILDRGGHTPLYAVANECASTSGAELVRVLVDAGANVNACGGVTRATPLHMAARRGHLEIARALLACGAQRNARDNKNVTPLQRAINCRQGRVAEFLKTGAG